MLMLKTSQLQLIKNCHRNEEEFKEKWKRKSEELEKADQIQDVDSEVGGRNCGEKDRNNFAMRNQLLSGAGTDYRDVSSL